jgi:hypothetical protein
MNYKRREAPNVLNDELQFVVYRSSKDTFFNRKVRKGNSVGDINFATLRIFCV